MKLLAPAKINLFLEVLDRRPDGYHTIQTVFQTVSLFDTVELYPAAGTVSLHCDSPLVPSDERNLALKAALAYREKYRITEGVRIKLTKRIPVGAGLGGGSSDAAAVLTGLSRLWKRKVPGASLAQLAGRLGADVPFFLTKGCAYAGGVGEKLKVLTGVKPTWFLLAYPRFPISTAWTYRNLKFPLTRQQKINKIKKLLSSGVTPDIWGEHLYNRLEEPVLRHYPDIRRMKDVLAALGGAHAMMSGSGSTVFAVIKSQEKGKQIRSKLLKYPWDTWVVQSVFPDIVPHT